MINHFKAEHLQGLDNCSRRRLCNAYLSAGRGGDFLQMLQNDLDSARGGVVGDIEGVKDRFPRGGAMGLLESHPELIHK